MSLTPSVHLPVHAEDELRRMKTDFLSSLNHEIRTPLSGILGMADLLMETSLNDEQREYVSTARMCAEELLESLNSAIEFSAVSSELIALDEADFNLPEMLSAAIDQYRARALEKNLAFSASLDVNLPEVASGDAVRLRQILTHLLGNALKFTAAGSITVEVRALPGQDGKFVLEIAIRDTGVGIAPEKLPSIFESFCKGDSGLAQRYPGLGLGLALVSKIASLMGGNVSIESEPGHGSVARARVALGVPQDAIERTRPRPRRVLVAEDEIVSVRIITQMLARGQYIARAVASGEAAIAEAARNRYDAILMDLQLPGIDGFETARRIRALPGYTEAPILALTAHTGEEFRAECLKRGMQGFLEKPVRAEQLLAAVGRLLQ